MIWFRQHPYESRRTQANDVTMTTESRDLTAEKMRISVAAVRKEILHFVNNNIIVEVMLI